jgi:transposase
MSQRRAHPLRALTPEEQTTLTQLSRSRTEGASTVARAKIILAVAEGKSYQEAARVAGRRSNDAVSQLIRRFNTEGLAALQVRHAGGPAIRYGAAERERILREVRRTPDRERDGAARWSLTLLQRALRQAPDGLPDVSVDTIRRVLRDAGLSWQRDRSWCETGQAVRKRKAGRVVVYDPDGEAKKS